MQTERRPEVYEQPLWQNTSRPTNVKPAHSHLVPTMASIFKYKPLAAGQRETNPGEDGVLLCANCHAIAHWKTLELLGVDEIAALRHPARQ
jgi:hypothetical protein